MLNIVKVRLYLNEEQKTILHKTFGSVRFVYNIMLDKKIKAYEKNKTSISIFELIKELVGSSEESTSFRGWSCQYNFILIIL